ncbi:MAG TPA: flagellar biosynthetic protein FliO, partial [Longimicrobiales bacterium]
MTFAALAGVAAALGIALALLAYALHRLRLLARLPGPRRARLPMEVVGRVALGQRQGLAAVRVGERVLVVSVGDGGVRQVAEVEAQALVGDGGTAGQRDGANGLNGPMAGWRDGRTRPHQVAGDILGFVRGFGRAARIVGFLVLVGATVPAAAR